MTKHKIKFLTIFLVFLLAAPSVHSSGSKGWSEKDLPAGWKVWSEEDYPAEYYSKEIRARVVDAETGEPVEGAAVVASWILRTMERPPRSGTDRLEVIEAVTDKNGWFYIPAWVPKKRPVFTFLEKYDPRLSVFKVGYKAASFLNIRKAYLEKYSKKGIRSFESYEEMEKYHSQLKPGRPRTYKPKLKVYSLEEIESAFLDDFIRGKLSKEAISNDPVRESIWDGRTIQLHRPKDEKEYWMFVRRFQIDIDWAYCVQRPEAWERIRNAVLEVEEARKSKLKKYYLSTLPDDAVEIIYGEDKP